MALRAYDRWPGYIKNSFDDHKNSPITWPVVMEDCIRNGHKDADFITDVVFYLHVWDSHGWGKIDGKPDLIALWKFLNDFVKKRLRIKVVNREPATVDTEKWIKRYLLDVDCAKIANNKDRRERLEALRSLILLGLDGDNPRHNFDYSKYQYSGILSVAWHDASDRMQNVQNVRLFRKANALDAFQVMVGREVNKGGTIPNILNTIELSIFRNTSIFIAWLATHKGMADATMEGYNEVKWMKEIVRLGRSPKHVYHKYSKILDEALKNSFQ